MSQQLVGVVSKGTGIFDEVSKNGKDFKRRVLYLDDGDMRLTSIRALANGKLSGAEQEKLFVNAREELIGKSVTVSWEHDPTGKYMNLLSIDEVNDGENTAETSIEGREAPSQGSARGRANSIEKQVQLYVAKDLFISGKIEGWRQAAEVAKRVWLIINEEILDFLEEEELESEEETVL